MTTLTITKTTNARLLIRLFSSQEHVVCVRSRTGHPQLERLVVSEAAEAFVTFADTPLFLRFVLTQFRRLNVLVLAALD
jgi:hypothetical protein